MKQEFISQLAAVHQELRTLLNLKNNGSATILQVKKTLYKFVVFPRIKFWKEWRKEIIL